MYRFVPKCYLGCKLKTTIRHLRNSKDFVHAFPRTTLKINHLLSLPCFLFRTTTALYKQTLAIATNTKGLSIGIPHLLLPPLSVRAHLVHVACDLHTCIYMLAAASAVMNKMQCAHFPKIINVGNSNS